MKATQTTPLKYPLHLGMRESLVPPPMESVRGEQNPAASKVSSQPVHTSLYTFPAMHHRPPKQSVADNNMAWFFRPPGLDIRSDKPNPQSGTGFMERLNKPSERVFATDVMGKTGVRGSIYFQGGYGRAGDA
jgi:hypothetical protein